MTHVRRCHMRDRLRHLKQSQGNDATARSAVQLGGEAVAAAAFGAFARAIAIVAGGTPAAMLKAPPRAARGRRAAHASARASARRTAYRYGR